MARRPRIFAPGLVYHVIVRGNHREATFRGAQDYRAYRDRLGKYRVKHKVGIYAYCQMPNHVHLLVETCGPPLSKFMQGLQQSYTQYFNRKYAKVGHLFQGRYKAIVCERDGYLLELVRYIHLNPIRAKMVQRPEEYEHSSHAVYLRGDATGIVNPSKVLQLLGGPAGYRSFVLDGFGEGHKQEYYELDDQRFLGTPEFVENVKKNAEEEASVPAVSLAEAVELVAPMVHVEPGLLQGADRSWELSRARTLVVYVLTRWLGYRVKDVAHYFNRTPETISSSNTRFSVHSLHDPTVGQKIEHLVVNFTNMVRARKP